MFAVESILDAFRLFRVLQCLQEAYNTLLEPVPPPALPHLGHSLFVVGIRAKYLQILDLQQTAQRRS